MPAVAERLNITPNQLARLKTLVNRAAEAQILESNEPNAPSSTPACSQVQNYARKLGYEMIWPGLFPLLVKDKQQIHVDW